MYPFSEDCDHQSKGINIAIKKRTEYMVRGAGTQQHGDRNPYDNWEQDARVTAARQVRRETSPD